jgi:type I restriction enzyme S subunit
MSFPRYPKYKASGVEWLGEVPEGWTVRPLKTIASGAGALFIDGDWIESKDISNAGIRYLTSGNVGEGFYKEQGQGFITDETFNELKCTEVLPGDLLISRLNVPIGRACIVPDLGSRIVTCVDNVVVRPASIFNRQFCVFLLSCKGHLENTEILGRGATMPRLSRSVLGRLPFAFPSLPEQTAIAEFLDRETGKIDELVAEQRRLMELLKEKRQAVISHAVTKGLNPHAPMKPSGIEWLGDVPAGWCLKRLQNVCHFQSGKAHEPFICDDGIYMCVTSRFVSTEGIKCKMCSENISPAKLNDTLMVMSDLPNGRALAKAYFVADNRAYAVNQRVCILRPFSVAPKYLYYLLDRNPEFLQHDDGINQTHLSNSEFLKPQFPFPPFDEQVAIAAFLDTELAKFDTLTAEAQRAIDLLQERRTALISAAVTGQIDVRQQTHN